MSRSRTGSSAARCRIACRHPTAADEEKNPIALRHRRQPAHVADGHRIIEPELTRSAVRTSAGTLDGRSSSKDRRGRAPEP